MLPRAEQRQCHPDARRFHSVPPSAAPRPVATSSRTLPPRRWHGLWTPLSLICPYALYYLVCLPSSAEQTPCSLQAARKEEVPWTTGGPAGLHPRPSWPGRGPHLQTQFPYCSKQGNRIDRFICLLNLMITMGKMMIVLVLFHCLILIFNLFYLNFILQTVSVHTYWKWKGKKKITKTKANPALVPHHRNLEKRSVEDPVSKAQEGWGLQIRQPEVQRKLWKDRGWEGLEGTLDEGGLLRIAWWGRKLRMAVALQKSPSRIRIYQQPRESSFPWLFQPRLLKSVLCPIVGLKWVPRCVWRSGYPPSPQPTPAPHRKSDTGGSLEKKMHEWFRDFTFVSLGRCLLVC